MPMSMSMYRESMSMYQESMYHVRNPTSTC